MAIEIYAYEEQVNVNIVGSGGENNQTSVITVDSALSETSTNPVQNRVVTAKFKELSNGLTTADAIDYDLNVKAVNHRGYSSQAPENTIPAYILSKQKGFKYVECDVSFTSDGVAVLLHDATIDRTSNGSGNINEMTYAEALVYDFGSWKNSTYAGTKIATFEEFIMTCKAIGLHPYIEFKNSGGYTQEQITGIVDIVERCGMKGKVTYISFNATFLGYVKTADSKARLGYLANITDSTIATANGLKTEENEVFMDVSYGNVTEEKVAMCIENGLPLEIWTVNSQSVIESMNDYVTGVTSDNLIAGKILYDKYMTYTAPDSPDVPATGITLDKTTLTFDDSTTQTLTATVEPIYSTDTVVWSSSNEAVAKVSNGVVTPISKGSCVITATAGSVSANCNVTVNVEEIVTYTITRNLTNCTSSSNVTSINEGSAHTETLTVDPTYSLDSVTVTMGGVDVTSSVYVNGTINISAITGNVVITANAIGLTLTSISATYTGGEVFEGTPLTALTGIAVSGTYSDGSTTEITDYQLSGNIAVGANTVTVTYEGLTTTFTVTGVEKSDNVEGTLLYDWDFTQSLTDKVSNQTAVLSYNATGSTTQTPPTQNANGLTFDADCQICYLGKIPMKGKTIVLDIANFDFKGRTDAHIRFLQNLINEATSTGEGSLLYRKQIGWCAYQGAWSEPYCEALTGSGMDVINYFSGKMVKVVYDEVGKATLYVNNALHGNSGNIGLSQEYLYIGGAPADAQKASNGNQCYNMTITGIRIYENA